MTDPKMEFKRFNGICDGETDNAPALAELYSRIARSRDEYSAYSHVCFIDEYKIAEPISAPASRFAYCQKYILACRTFVSRFWRSFDGA